MVHDSRICSIKLTLAVAETDGKSLSLGLALRNIGRSVPDPRAVAANVGRELHVGDNVVVGADLEGLVTTHDESGSAVLLVLEQADLAGTTLLPLSAVAVELEELGTHLEGLLLALLVCLGVDFLGKVDNGLKVDVGLLVVNLVLLVGWCQYSWDASGMRTGVNLDYLVSGLCGGSLGASTAVVGGVILLVGLLLLGTTTEHAENIVLDGRGGSGGGLGGLLGDGLGLLSLGSVGGDVLGLVLGFKHGDDLVVM